MEVGEENWRVNDESLELAVLEAAIDVDRAKDASFCMREGDAGEGVNSRGIYKLRGCSDVLGVPEWRLQLTKLWGLEFWIFFVCGIVTLRVY